MFYYLKGIIAHKDENFAVVDAGGVGYKVYTSYSNLSKMELGTPSTLYTYMHIREDIMNIYGFLSKEELDFFELLISVSGVGPKAGLAVLSTLTPGELVIAVVTNDAKSISKAPGIGKKTAERIILELKDKIKDNEAKTAIETGGYEVISGETNEAISALIVLGYTEQEAMRAVKSVDSSKTKVEDIIKDALRFLVM